MHAPVIKTQHSTVYCNYIKPILLFIAALQPARDHHDDVTIDGSHQRRRKSSKKEEKVKKPMTRVVAHKRCDGREKHSAAVSRRHLRMGFSRFKLRSLQIITPSSWREGKHLADQQLKRHDRTTSTAVSAKQRDPPPQESETRELPQSNIHSANH